MSAPTIRQVRAAMALVGWPQKLAAHHIGVQSRGIVSDSLCGARRSALPRLQAALEAAGVEFIAGGCRLVINPTVET